jgi:DNA-binding transcriptional MocR family regulator
MSLNRRRDVLALAEYYGLTIVEDDCYRRLSYDASPPPTLKAEDRANLVIHLSGVSKIMMSGLRIGYIVAPKAIHEQLLALRRATDLCNPPMVQRTVAEFIQRGHLKSHLKRIVPLYRERRDVLMQTLADHMPPYVEWSYPHGGFSCWMSIPQSKAPADLYEAALRYEVAFTPGDVFLIEKSEDTHLRLCFGNQPSEVIRESVIILSQLLRRNRRTLIPASALDHW